MREVGETRSPTGRASLRAGDSFGTTVTTALYVNAVAVGMSNSREPDGGGEGKRNEPTPVLA